MADGTRALSACTSAAQALVMLEHAIRMSHSSFPVPDQQQQQQQQQQERASSPELPAESAEAIDIVLDILQRFCDTDAAIALEAVNAARTIIKHSAGSPRIILAMRMSGAANHVARALRSFPNRQMLVLQAVSLLTQLLSAGAPLAPLAFLRSEASASSASTDNKGEQSGAHQKACRTCECGISKTLSTVLEIHIHNSFVASAVFDLLLLLTRNEKSAEILLGAPDILIAAQAQLKMLSNAEATASAVLFFKQISKHYGTRQKLLKHCEENKTVAMLVDIVRVLQRSSGVHFKTLKRAYRTCWLLSQPLMHPVVRSEKVPLSLFVKPRGKSRDRKKSFRASSSASEPDSSPGSEAGGGGAPGKHTSRATEEETECSCYCGTELRWFPEHASLWKQGELENEDEGGSPRRVWTDCHCADNFVRGTGHSAHDVTHPTATACSGSGRHGGERREDDGISSNHSAFNAYKKSLEVDTMLHFLERIPDVPTASPAGTLVYDSDISPAAAEAGADGGLVFESNFESGNLRKAIRIGPMEYDLHLRHDINDDAMRCQWFLFAVRNAVPGRTYRFNILNLGKKTSLFQMGQRPLVLRPGHDVWEHAQCTGIAYVSSPLCQPEASVKKEQERGQNKIRKGVKPARKPKSATHEGRGGDGEAVRLRGGLYDLSFSIRFDSAEANYLSHCFPFTYTDQQARLRRIFSDQTASSGVIRRSLLCKTVMGHRCDLLTVTDFTGGPPMEERKYVFLSARVHPGESNSSWVMDGLIRRLLGADDLARRLRSQYVFKIVPMLNPDGVIVGNTRCDISGDDLNRQWDSPKKVHPTIRSAKRLCESLPGKLALFVDLHGHSRETDFFLYGCGPPLDCSTERTSAPAEEAHLLPLILAELHDEFSLQKCAFKITRSKQGTGRVVLNRDVGCQLAYTLEVSLAGGSSSSRHFSSVDLETIGSKLVEAIYELFVRLEGH